MAGVRIVVWQKPDGNIDVLNRDEAAVAAVLQTLPGRGTTDADMLHLMTMETSGTVALDVYHPDRPLPRD